MNVISLAIKHRQLLLALTKREIRVRYKGSFFGILWAFLVPTLMLLVFTFVFGEIFQAKWGASSDAGGVDFAAALFAGFIIFSFFSECVGKAPSLITSNVNYVKKVVFPLELLPVVTILAAAFHFLIAFLILLVLIHLSSWSLTWTIVSLPLIFLPFLAMTLGVTFIVSALGVYLRDIGQLIGPVLTGVLFLSPVFYPLSSVPEPFLWLYHLNPLTFQIEEARGVLLAGIWPDWEVLALYTVFSLLILFIGNYLFGKSKSGFADVL